MNESRVLRRAAPWACAWGLAAVCSGGLWSGPVVAQAAGEEQNGAVTEQPALDESAAQPALASPWQARGLAEIQALDKAGDRVATLNVPVGQTVQFEHLSITARACAIRPPDQPADAAAYVQIVDLRAGWGGFAGWLLAAEPFVTVLQHPTFDVRVLGCR